MAVGPLPALASSPATSLLAIEPRSASYGAPGHDALLAARRTGRIAPAQVLRQLEAWLATPLDAGARRRVASDAIVVAVDEAQFTEAAALGHAHPPARLHGYALGPLALAARRTHDLALQAEVIGAWREREPASRPLRMHEAYWRLASADLPGAKALSDGLTREISRDTGAARDDRVALLELRAAIARAEGQPLQALVAYDEAITLHPERRDLHREASFLLAEAGAATTASREAEATEHAQPGTFSALALSTLQQQALAQRLRWAIEARDQRLGAARLIALDQVLTDQEGALARLDNAARQADRTDVQAWQALRRQLLADRLLALVERGRTSDTIALYDSLQAGTDLPAHALGATARALAQERRSAEAVPLYEAAVARAGAALPVSDPIHFGLVYAYQDTGRFEEADALLDRLEHATPALMRLTPEAGRPNEEYTDLAGLRGLTQLYTDRPALAQQRFAYLMENAPLNAGHAYGAGRTERLREHPEAAVAIFEAQAADEPHDLSARSGHVEALLDSGRFAEARRRAESLMADAPDSAAARDTDRKRRALIGPRLDIDAEAARGGSALAYREWRVDSRLSSGLVDDAWRVFYDQSQGRGSTDVGAANWVRAGLGLAWQRDRWGAEGALQHANRGPYRNGVAGRIDYRASDAWRLSATYDGDSKMLPWKARAADIGARARGADLAYVRNESRRFELQWQRLDFSDGNVREGLDLGWRERWISTPRFQLETRLGGGPSRGRALDTPYFNPSHDASVQFTARLQWLQWKRDERQFFQAIELEGGGYRQAGFGTAPQWTLRYEQRWELGPSHSLRYGLSLSSHPYDGERELQRGVFLNLSMPL